MNAEPSLWSFGAPRPFPSNVQVLKTNNSKATPCSGQVSQLGWCDMDSIAWVAFSRCIAKEWANRSHETLTSGVVVPLASSLLANWKINPYNIISVHTVASMDSQGQMRFSIVGVVVENSFYSMVQTKSLFYFKRASLRIKSCMSRRTFVSLSHD